MQRFNAGPRRMAVLAVVLLSLFIASASAQAPIAVSDAVIRAERPAETLSAYHFFRDRQAREANAGVTPYDLNTPLWSDGALKFRYVYVPNGAPARYRDDGVFDFPVGTVLIKTFAFATDMRRPTEHVRFIETRLLIRRAEGWVALPYVWNEEQTEARYSPVGAEIPLNFTDVDGNAIALQWSVPNRNQCKGCHDRRGEFTPIGPSARNLNREFSYATGAENQLVHWSAAGLVEGVPSSGAPRAPDAYSTEEPLDQRARAYLDVNCAHCHNPDGPAHTSGLDLRWSQSEPALWGVFKRPIAAGRGAGDMNFAIEPGHPERSILVHRMESTDPGVMMPETGRTLVDRRAVVLMRDWISAMDGQGRSR